MVMEVILIITEIGLVGEAIVLIGHRAVVVIVLNVVMGIMMIKSKVANPDPVFLST